MAFVEGKWFGLGFQALAFAEMGKPLLPIRRKLPEGHAQPSICSIFEGTQLGPLRF